MPVWMTRHMVCMQVCNMREMVWTGDILFWMPEKLISSLVNLVCGCQWFTKSKPGKPWKTNGKVWTVLPPDVGRASCGVGSDGKQAAAKGRAEGQNHGAPTCRGRE